MAATAIASSLSIHFKPLTPTADNASPALLKLLPTSARLVPFIYHASSSLLARDHPPPIPVKWCSLKVSADVAQEVEGEAPEAGADAEVVEEGGEAVAEAEAEAPVNTKLYVGNLPYNIDSSQLAGIIQQYGSPELVEVLYDRETGRSRGFAFVTMTSIEDCNAVIQNLDRSDCMGRILRVNFSDKPKPKEPLYPETEFKLFIGNLSWSVTSESLTKAFQPYGNVVGARVLYEGETGRSRGYGFVSYSTESELETALQSLDGVELEGRAMRVGRAQGRRS